MHYISRLKVPLVTAVTDVTDSTIDCQYRHEFRDLSRIGNSSIAMVLTRFTRDERGTNCGA
jgi:hypothetical protein